MHCGERTSINYEECLKLAEKPQFKTNVNVSRPLKVFGRKKKRWICISSKYPRQSSFSLLLHQYTGLLKIMYIILKYYKKLILKHTLLERKINCFSFPLAGCATNVVVVLLSLESKMASQQELSFFVLQYALTESVILVQRAFCKLFGKVRILTKVFVRDITNLKKEAVVVTTWLYLVSFQPSDYGTFSCRALRKSECIGCDTATT